MENPLTSFLSRRNACRSSLVVTCLKLITTATRPSTAALCIAALLFAGIAQAQVSSVWNGRADTDWNNPANWEGGIVPATNSNVIVLAAAPFSPAIRSGVSVHNLELQPGKTLDLTNTSISINGTISGTGTFTVSPLSSLTIGGTAGGSAGSIRFTASSNTIGYLTLNRSGVAASVALASPLSVSHVFTVVAGTFYTADQLTLKSDATNSARIGASAGTIAGKLTIEKYIPARRAWRLLCPQVAGAGAPYINAAWQEAAVSSLDDRAPGYGTHITGGPAAKGFDQSPTNSSSIKYMYNNAWSDLANTNATLVTRYPGYLFFVRGNRSYDIASTVAGTTPLPTVLRTTGNVHQGSLPAVSIPASGLTLVANPYASPVSFSAVAAAGVNLKNRLYVWDPSLGGAAGVGGYVVVEWNGEGYTTVPATGANSIIPAGQAFFVESANGTSTGKVYFNESQKVASAAIEPFRSTAISQPSLTINLQVFNDDRTTAMTDGVMALYNSNFSGAVDKNDAVKFNNLSDNLSILSKGKQLSIERRTLPVEADTLTLNIASLRKTEYQLEIIPANFVATGMMASLYDRFNNAVIPISSTETTRYTFAVSANALSQQAGRFSIFYRTAPLTISLPQAEFSRRGTIDLGWEIINAQNVAWCEVEKSTTQGIFKSIGTAEATGPTGINAIAYRFTDDMASPGANIYRIKATTVTGQVLYSETARLTIKNPRPFDPTIKIPVSPATVYLPRSGKQHQAKAVKTAATPGIAVFPNPVTGHTITLSLSNVPKGLYQVEMISQAGQLVYQSTTALQGNGKQLINLKGTIASGAYKLHARQGLTVYETSVLVVR